MWWRRFERLAALTVTLGSVACGSAGPQRGPAEDDSCETVNAAREACGLEVVTCEEDESACYAECFFGWGCEELERPETDPGITACLWNCSPRFTCEDGVEVYAAYVCDGIGDCSGLEDERNCAPATPTPATNTAVAGASSAPLDGGVPPAAPLPFDGGSVLPSLLDDGGSDASMSLSPEGGPVTSALARSRDADVETASSAARGAGEGEQSALEDGSAVSGGGER